jgi:glycine/D-amino acid oxidase-like deaminating enzyme
MMARLHHNHHKPHVVVVGAGILGASIAFHLTLHGVPVTIVDAGEPGQGTSRVSFAWLNAYGKTPFHYHDFNRRSMDMWERFARRLGGTIDLVWGGELRWSVTAAGAADLAARAQRLQTWGYPTRLIDARELQALEPDLRVDSMTAASYTSIDGHVDTGQVIQACIKAATERGAELRTKAAVTGLPCGHTRAGEAMVEGVMIGDEVIPCDIVVLAGGADMPALAALAGVVVPLYHTFGATVLTEPVAPMFKTIAVLHSPRDRHPLVNFRQFADGTVMMQSGAPDNTHEGDRGHTDAEVEQIVADACEVLPALQGVRINEVRRGRRPIPRDGEPMMGFSPAVSNLYVATTHSGVTLAPIMGELAAIEIAEGARIDLLRPFRIERFGAARPPGRDADAAR